MKNLKMFALVAIALISYAVCQLNAQVLVESVNPSNDLLNPKVDGSSNLLGQGGAGIQKPWYQQEEQFNNYLKQLQDAAQGKISQAKVEAEKIRAVLDQKAQQLKNELSSRSANFNNLVPDKKVVIEKLENMKKELDNSYAENKELFLQKAKALQDYLNQKYNEFKASK